MATIVSIPTLKRTDHSRNCLWDNVGSYCIRSNQRPHEEIIRAAYRCFVREQMPDKGMWEYSVSLEHIHKQHHYSGDKLRFIENFNIGKTYNCYILTNVCGAIFMQLASGKISYDEAAKSAKADTSNDYIGSITL